MRAPRDLYEAFEASSDEARRLLRQEELILTVTEMIHQRLEEAEMTQADLAKRLRKTRGYISQLLTGRRNMTLRTLADLADAVGGRVTVGIRPHRWPAGKLVLHPSAGRWEDEQFEVDDSEITIRRDPSALRKMG